MEHLGDGKDAALAKFPHVAKLIQNIQNHQKVAEWLSKRPITVM
jgi:hypothetical protein